jgi:hypothetical protein
MGDVIWGTDFRGKVPVGTEIPKAELSHIELMALDVFNFAMLGEPVAGELPTGAISRHFPEYDIGCGRTIYESSLGYLPDR